MIEADVVVPITMTIMCVYNYNRQTSFQGFSRIGAIIVDHRVP